MPVFHHQRKYYLNIMTISKKLNMFGILSIWPRMIGFKMYCVSNVYVYIITTFSWFRLLLNIPLKYAKISSWQNTKEKTMTTTQRKKKAKTLMTPETFVFFSSISERTLYKNDKFISISLIVLWTDFFATRNYTPKLSKHVHICVCVYVRVLYLMCVHCTKYFTTFDIKVLYFRSPSFRMCQYDKSSS